MMYTKTDIFVVNGFVLRLILWCKGGICLLGRIKYLNIEEGYGYIHSDETRKDYSFRLTGNEGYKEGMTVNFDVSKSTTGKEYALNIKLCSERNIVKFNTEDKKTWCNFGASREIAFVENVVPLLELDIIVNPEKVYNPYVIDLFDRTSSKYADLKTQNTPFFTAGKYGVDPQYAVTFNKKDYDRYCKLYPMCDIYFHVQWEQESYRNIVVNPLSGVWVAKFADMRSLIEKNMVPLHPYKYRGNDLVNAKDSFVFDLRNDIFTRLL